VLGELACADLCVFRLFRPFNRDPPGDQCGDNYSNISTPYLSSSRRHCWLVWRTLPSCAVQTVHAFLERWSLCLADCPIDDDVPTDWLVTLLSPDRATPPTLSPATSNVSSPLSSRTSVGLPRFAYHINLDTDITYDQFVRNSIIIHPEWQKDQLGKAGRLRAFLSESGIYQSVGGRRKPAFYLICMGQNEL